MVSLQANIAQIILVFILSLQVAIITNMMSAGYELIYVQKVLHLSIWAKHIEHSICTYLFEIQELYNYAKNSISFTYFINFGKFELNQYCSKMFKQPTNSQFQQRQIRIQRQSLNAQQKLLFHQIFDQNPIPNFLMKHYYSIVVNGVPAEFRNYLWPQFIPNHYRIEPYFYYAMVEQHLRNKKIIQMSGLKTKWKDSGVKLTNYSESQQSMSIAASYTDEGMQQYSINPEINNSSHKLTVWVNNIEQDVLRTFPQLLKLHESGECQCKLANILGCFTIFRDDIGYVQGLSSIAAILLIQLRTEYRAFTALTTLITTTPLYYFYSFQTHPTNQICHKIKLSISKKSKQISSKIVELEYDFNMTVIKWIMTLFTNCFSIYCISQLWDIIFLNHTSQCILQEICMAVVLAKEKRIMECDQSYQIIQLLSSTKLTASQQQSIFQYLRTIVTTSL